MRAAAVLLLAVLFAAPAVASELMDVKSGALKARSSAVAGKGSLPQVQGIVAGGGRAFVLIGGRAYGKGDRAGGFLIKDISPGRVIFEAGGREIVLSMGEGG